MVYNNENIPRICGVVINIKPMELRLESMGFISMDLETVIAISVATWDHAQDNDDFEHDLINWLRFRLPDFFQAEIVRKASYAGVHYASALAMFVDELVIAVGELVDYIDHVYRPVLEMFIYEGGWEIIDLLFFGTDSCLIRYGQKYRKSPTGKESLLYRLDAVYSSIEKYLRYRV